MHRACANYILASKEIARYKAKVGSHIIIIIVFLFLHFIIGHVTIVFFATAQQ